MRSKKLAKNYPVPQSREEADSMMTDSANRRGVGFAGFGNWYESYGDNVTTFSNGQLTYNDANANGNIDYGRLLQPLEIGANFTNGVSTTFKDAYNPIIDTCSFRTSAGSAEVFADMDQFEFRNITTNSWDLSNISFKSQLPVLGELSTPDEKYAKQSVSQSQFMVGFSSIVKGASADGVTNLISSAITDTSLWPVSLRIGNSGQAMTVTGGQPDPFGGTDAVRITRGRVRTAVVDAVNVNDRRVFAVAVKASVAGASVLIRAETANTAGNAKEFEIRLPDTKWRVVYIQYKVRVSGILRLSLGASTNEANGILFFRPNLWQGADLSPLLNPNQSISGAFEYSFGNVITTGDDQPVTGFGFRGDIVKNRLPSAGQPSYWQCVATGAPGAWRAVDLN